MPKKNFGSYGNLTNLFTALGNKLNKKVSWSDASRSVKKNLIPYPYTSLPTGLPFVDNGDGSFTVGDDITSIANHNYTLCSINLPKGSYIFSGGLNNDETVGGTNYYIYLLVGSTWYKSTGSLSERSFTLNADATVQLRLLNATTQVLPETTYYPMVRFASIQDGSFESFIYDNVELKEQIDGKVEWDAASKSVKKNLLPQDDVNPRTINDVVFTSNSDGSVTVDGTASNTCYFHIKDNIDFGNQELRTNSASDITRNGYTISSHISGDIVDSNDIFLKYNSSNNQVYIQVSKNAVIDNVTIYPMIRLASIQDDTYEPFIYDNVELKEQIDTKDEGIEVTQAQYDALPSSKNSDGKNYYITDSTPVAVILNDNTVGTDRVWSSQKTKAYVDGLITDALSASY